MIKSNLLWVLEKPKQSLASIALRLQGEFAVRCFASIENMVSIARLRHTARPSVVLVNCSDYDEESALIGIRSTLHDAMPQAYKIFVGADSRFFETLKESEAFLNKSDREILAFLVSKLVQQMSFNPACEANERAAFQLGSAYFDGYNLTVTEKDSGEVVQLPFKEAKILQLMLQTPSKCVSREIMMQKLWPRLKVSPRTLDSHISRLRKRIEPVGLTIDSEYGAGYVLRLSQEI